MNARFELDVDDPALTRRALAPSLRDTGAAACEVTAEDTLHVTVEADALGPLRGATNTVLMLTRLSERLQGVYDGPG